MVSGQWEKRSLTLIKLLFADSPRELEVKVAVWWRRVTEDGDRLVITNTCLSGIVNPGLIGNERWCLVITYELRDINDKP